MLHGAAVGLQYNVVLDAYAAEGRHPDDVLVFREMLRNGTKAELQEWYDLYRDALKPGETRRIKKEKAPK